MLRIFRSALINLKTISHMQIQSRFPLHSTVEVLVKEKGLVSESYSMGKRSCFITIDLDAVNGLLSVIWRAGKSDER